MLARGRWALLRSSPKLHNSAGRPFSTAIVLHDKPLPPRRAIDENEITEAFLKGSGPGGQKINKTSSAVQLKHLPTGIVVKCQGTRSREQNRKDARRLLAERLEELEKGDESRTAIKAERARVKKASAAKKSRRKYKTLAEEKAAEGHNASNEEGGESRSGGNSSDVVNKGGFDSSGNAVSRQE